MSVQQFDLRRAWVVGPVLALSLLFLWTLAPASASAAAPVCEDRSYTVESGADLSLPVDGPCTDDGDPGPLSAQIVNYPMFGSISPGPGGTGVYRSYVGYEGSDSFTYTASDGAETSNVATVNITVTAPAGGYAPQCYGGYVEEFNGLGGATFAVGCYDPDSPYEDLVATLVDPPQHGQLAGPLAHGTSNTYTSDPGYSGLDSLTYRVSDGVHDSALTTLTFNVRAVPAGNLPPTCPESHVYVPEGGYITLKANCIDPDPLDTITYGLAAPYVSLGTIDQFTATSVRYHPYDTTLAGAVDWFGYTARDPYHPPVHFSGSITITGASDTVFETAPEATVAEPLATQVESPVLGPVSIDVRAVTEVAPTGYFFLGQEFDIKAPGCARRQRPAPLRVQARRLGGGGSERSGRADRGVPQRR